MKPNTTKMAGLGVLFLFVAGAAAVTAERTETDLGFERPPPECKDFNEDWKQLKVDEDDDFRSGNFSDGTLNVTIVVTDEDDGEPLEFDWSSNIGVSAVIVVDGVHGDVMYEYDPAATSDEGLVAGDHIVQEGKTGAISHVLFCYMLEDDEEPPNGDKPPLDDECPPGSLSATANGDGSITVRVHDLEGNATLMRSDGGEFEQVATFNATSDTYHDTDTVVGVTYTYQLRIEGLLCDQIEVTAIPVFPGMIAAVLATGLGVLGYVGLRRRS